jgi:hypothetical protein
VSRFKKFRKHYHKMKRIKSTWSIFMCFIVPYTLTFIDIIVAILLPLSALFISFPNFICHRFL